jgi:hypothetical protein
MIGDTLEAPSNCWTTNEQFFVDALIASTAFQDIVEAGSGPGTVAENTAAHVFLEESPRSGTYFDQEELEQLRHFAYVTSANEDGYRLFLVSTKHHETTGQVRIGIERLIRDSEWMENGRHIPMRWFKNRVGDFMRGLQPFSETYNGAAGPIMQSINVDFGPRENREIAQPTQGFWLSCQLSIEWMFNGEGG